MNIGSTIIAAALYMASMLSGRPVPSGMEYPVVFTAKEAFGERLTSTGTMGMTSMSDGHIVLHLGWKDDLFGHCILVHELTHYLQFANNRVFISSAEDEIEAWNVTAKCYAVENANSYMVWAHRRKLDYMINQAIDDKSSGE